MVVSGRKIAAWVGWVGVGSAGCGGGSVSLRAGGDEAERDLHGQVQSVPSSKAEMVFWRLEERSKLVELPKDPLPPAPGEVP